MFLNPKIVSTCNKSFEKFHLRPFVERIVLSNVIMERQEFFCIVNASLSIIGIPVPTQKLTTTREETIAAAEEIGFPIVMKLMAEDVVHKSDTGAVKLNLQTKEDIKGAYDELMNIPSQMEKKISVQKMADEPITELL